MISKKIRFEIFKRDGFQCAYCGKTPPEVTLEVDHIEPISLGGSDDMENLLTACFDCNRGKKNIRLDKIPNKLVRNLEILKEKEEQLKEYRKFIQKIEKRIQRDIDKIEDEYHEYYSIDSKFTDNFRNVTIKRFIGLLPLHEIIEAMKIACSKISNNPESALRYFCGVCWNKIKGINPFPEINIIALWKKISASYEKGSGWCRESDIEEIKNIDINVLETLMKKAYSKRRPNYWDSFMDHALKEKENLIEE